MKIHNLTGHNFTIIDYKGNTVVLPPEGEARVLNARRDPIKTSFFIKGKITLIEVRSILEESTVGLPEPSDDDVYIVSWPVAHNNLDRDDLLIGDDQIRDKRGNVIAVSTLAYLERKDQTNGTNLQDR